MERVQYESSEKKYGNYTIFSQTYSKKSGFQQIDIGDSEAFGRILFLDGTIQMAEADEFIYHESLIHPAMCSTSPKKILILGGGDLCALREALKHPIEKAVVVDIDPEVIEAAKEHLAGINRKSWEDPRAEVKAGDALEYLKTTDEKFDVIISDLTDPEEAGGYFYSREFYGLCKNAMSESAILATHGSVSSNPEFTAEKTYAAFRELFKYSSFYSTHIQSFNSTYGFLMGSDSINLASPDWKTIEENTKRINGPLKHYSPEVHRSMLTIPAWMEEQMKEGRHTEWKAWFSEKPPQ